MAKPHKCPVCDGAGKLSIAPYGSSTSISLGYVQCNACQGKGIVWEADTVPLFEPRPQSLPITPDIGLTFPEDFKFPKEISEATTKTLIKTLEDWIRQLKEDTKDDA